MLTDRVVQVIEDATGETVYTLRINGTSFRPKVFKDGLYTIKVGEPGIGRTRTLTSVRPIGPNEHHTVGVDFQKDGTP